MASKATPPPKKKKKKQGRATCHDIEVDDDEGDEEHEDKKVGHDESLLPRVVLAAAGQFESVSDVLWAKNSHNGAAGGWRALP